MGPLCWSLPQNVGDLTGNSVTTCYLWGRENFICKAGIPEGQLPIYAGAYVTVHNKAHIEKKNPEIINSYNDRHHQQNQQCYEKHRATRLGVPSAI